MTKMMILMNLKTNLKMLTITIMMRMTMKIKDLARGKTHIAMDDVPMV